MTPNNTEIKFQLSVEICRQPKNIRSTLVSRMVIGFFCFLIERDADMHSVYLLR